MFYSSTGHFLTQVLIVAVVLVSLYCKLFLAGAGLQAAATAAAASDESAVRELAATLYRTVFAQQLLSAYLLGIVGGFFSTACERGFRLAAAQLGHTVLRGGLLFYGFLLQTKAHYVHATIVYGKASYQGTGRGFVIEYEGFASIYRRFWHSHFALGYELFVLLCVYFASHGYAGDGAFVAYELPSIFFAFLLLATPFVFNPEGVNFAKLTVAAAEWFAWMDAGWEAWWRAPAVLLASRPLGTRLLLVAVPRLRRLVIFWACCVLASAKSRRARFSFTAAQCGLIGVAAVAAFLVFRTLVEALGRRDRSPEARWRRARRSRMLHFGFVGAASIAVVLGLALNAVRLLQLVWAILGFAVLAYCVVDFALALAPTPAAASVPAFVAVNKAAHYVCGLTLLVPFFCAAFVPFISDFHTRMMWNIEFSERLEVAKLFARQQRRGVKAI